MVKIYVFFLGCFIFSFGQVGIGTTNPEAAMDVESSSSGILIPRVTLSANNISLPIINPQGGNLVEGTMVYNTAYAGVFPYEVRPGFYYWMGDKWNRMQAENRSGSIEWFFDGGLGATHAANATYMGSALYEDTGYGSRGIRLCNAGQNQVGTVIWSVPNFDFSEDFRFEFRAYIDTGGDSFSISIGGDTSHGFSYSGYTMGYNNYSGIPRDLQFLGIGPLVSKYENSINMPTGSFRGNWVTGRLEVFTDNYTGKKFLRSYYSLGDDWVTALISEITDDITPTNNIKINAWGGSNTMSVGFYLQNAKLIKL